MPLYLQLSFSECFGKSQHQMAPFGDYCQAQEQQRRPEPQRRPEGNRQSNVLSALSAGEMEARRKALAEAHVRDDCL